MPTNEEIQKRHGSKKGDLDYNGIRDMLNEARADTTKQIFAELEKHDTGYGGIVLFKEDIQALKKRFKVD